MSDQYGLAANNKHGVRFEMPADGANGAHKVCFRPFAKSGATARHGIPVLGGPFAITVCAVPDPGFSPPM